MVRVLRPGAGAPEGVVDVVDVVGVEVPEEPQPTISSDMAMVPMTRERPRRIGAP